MLLRSASIITPFTISMAPQTLLEKATTSTWLLTATDRTLERAQVSQAHRITTYALASTCTRPVAHGKS